MSKWKRRLLRTLVVGMALLVLIVGWAWFTCWRRLPHYEVSRTIELAVPIMTAAEYGKIISKHARPYVVHLEQGEGGVLLFGSEHTRDPKDPQIQEIRTRWDSFRPTVALCEGRMGILFPQLMDPVRTFCEPGAVRALAISAKIPVYSWEPTPKEYVHSLLQQPFSKEQIALRLKLNSYFSNLRFGKPSDPEAFVADAIDDDRKCPGLENVLRTPTEINAAWQKYFPDGPDWRDVSDEYGLPGFLGEIDTNAARDEHFVRVILDLVGQGERVFAIAGLSHAVKLEPALKAALQDRP